MTQTISKQTSTAAAISLLTLLLLASTAVRAGAQSDAADGAGLTGAWMVKVTLRDCTTGAPLGPVINSLVTFHRDGTISEAAGGLAFAPGQRSPGHGAWRPEAERTFGQEMIAMILFDTAPNLPGTPGFDPSKPVSPGFFAGWVTISHSIRFTAVDRIASTGTNAFYTTSGDVYRSGCSTATGQRFE